jgi:hypothetical protein
MARVDISPAHLQRLSERIGREWAVARDAEVQAFRNDDLAAQTTQTASVAAVMVDGGRAQTRADEAGPGVSEPGWREVKVACCQTLNAAARAIDPQPEPPAKFLDPVQAARLAAEIKSRKGPARQRADKSQQPSKKKRRRAKKKKRPGRPERLVRTVVASMASSEVFGWQVAAEVCKRGLGRVARKAYVCDGQKYNWSIYEMHFIAQGFIGILDFIHLLGYLYGAAQAAAGKGSAEAWSLYERWLRWAWGGQVKEVLAGLRAAARKLGPPPENCSEDDPRKVVADTLGYVENNRTRMDYPRYRCLGLPVSSAYVESTIKQVNRRIKGTEKFWLEGGAEAILQIRAAHLSEDNRVDRYWSRPRPRTKAVGAGSLRPAR